jgi:hypothetical protein
VFFLSFNPSNKLSTWYWCFVTFQCHIYFLSRVTTFVSISFLLRHLMNFWKSFWYLLNQLTHLEYIMINCLSFRGSYTLLTSFNLFVLWKVPLVNRCFTFLLVMIIRCLLGNGTEVRHWRLHDPRRINTSRDVSKPSIKKDDVRLSTSRKKEIQIKVTSVE